MDLKQVVKDEIELMDKHKLDIKFHYNEMEFDNEKLGKNSVKVFVEITKI